MLEELGSMQEGCQEKVGEDVKMVESVVNLLSSDHGKFWSVHRYSRSSSEKYFVGRNE